MNPLTPLLILALAGTGLAQAQQLAPFLEERPAIASKPRAYGYMNSLELSVGGSRKIGNYDHLPDHGLSQVGDKWAGIEFTARYTHFFSKHWGGFFHIGVSSHRMDEYDYEQGLYDQFVPDRKEGEESPMTIRAYNRTGPRYGTFLLGTVYRYDIGRWSFRPSFGLGLRRLHTWGVTEYYRYRADAPQYEERIVFRTENKDGESRRFLRAFALSPNFQINYTPRNHMYFLGEVGLLCPFRRLYQRTIIHAYERPAPLPEEEKTDENLTQQRPKYLGVVDNFRQSYRMPTPYSIRFGVGWNIGQYRGLEHRRSAR